MTDLAGWDVGPEPACARAAKARGAGGCGMLIRNDDGTLTAAVLDVLRILDHVDAADFRGDVNNLKKGGS